MKEKTGYGKIKVPNNLLSAIDAVVGTFGYRTRAEFVNGSIRCALKQLATLLQEINAMKRQEKPQAVHPKTCPECGSMDFLHDGKCKACGSTQQQANRIKAIDRAIQSLKSTPQQRLAQAQRQFDEVSVKLEDARKKGNKDTINLYQDLWYSLQNEIGYWTDVVAGKR